ncbi:MAG: 16S rRNA (uracil(1498)-N(3))-methyltransferase [Steroidobacteraceae bacterium]|jgi:16S rRNA (uracil1498-N3)-methyltransferase
MRLTRVYVETCLEAGAALELPPETAAHVAKVLRARVGDGLILFNGDGREFSAEIESVRGARVRASVGPGTFVDRESALAVTLVQSVPRGDRMDFIVQKATELGVARIVPTLSQRSVVRLDARQSEAKATHWRAVVVSACEQCGRNRVPAVEEPRQLIDYLGAAAGGGTRLVLEPDADADTVTRDVAGSVEIAIGPEGGFAPDELEAFHLAGFKRVRFGPRILRTETAAIAALTWLQTQFGDMR